MYTHCGLYFSDKHILAARKGRDRAPLKAAWTQLHDIQPTDDLAAILIGGFLYRFDDNVSAGMQAAKTLYNLAFPTDKTLHPFRTMATLAQASELVRPLFSAEELERWHSDFEAHLGLLSDSSSYHESVWREALYLIAGVMLEKREWVERSAESYRRIVREDIHPDGYIHPVVEQQDGQSFFRHIITTQALVLMAETAKHIGIDLWGYEQRGVSVVTAAAYPLYYYFYPKKWRWDEHHDEEDTQRIFREHGGFLEIVNRQRPLHDIGLLLNEWRPVFDVYGGGLTTLSHGSAAKRGLFG
jgi:hypothetical protein